jgi:hypothetical protein
MDGPSAIYHVAGYLNQVDRFLGRGVSCQMSVLVVEQMQQG